MSAPKIKAPRGTYDVLGEESSARTALESRARAILEPAGYERIETPVFESTELFSRGVGASSDIVRKEMFSFQDAGGRELTLRPEGTAPICRAYVEHGMHKRRLPVKLWYLSSFFRYERAQAGRQREFWQVGAEALGSEDPALDAESIVLANAVLTDLGVRQVRLRLSSLGSPEARGAYRESLTAYLRANEGSLSEEVRARIDLNPLRAFDSEHPGTAAVMEQAPRLLDQLGEQDLDHFAEVRTLLDAAGVSYEIDPTLVRGLDYYTRTVFEFTSDALGAQSGVGGGGRYDGLVEELGGKPTPGIGWAAGVERILLAGEVPSAAPAPVELFIVLEDGSSEARAGAFALLTQARGAGLSAQMDLAGRSLKGQLNHAEAIGARYVAIVGVSQTVLKDRQQNLQEPIAIDAIVHAVLRGQHAL
ncbi:MAG TPA: histidine--tRNA ligase [Solirubrobacteraceae bacterium]|nr:histidine--tRNA ligase [Solirubrobacteraceae bacterium]